MANAVLGNSSWAVLGSTLHIELFTQSHYRESIREEGEPSEQERFLFHWQEDSRDAIMDELEWRRVNTGTSAAARER